MLLYSAVGSLLLESTGRGALDNETVAVNKITIANESPETTHEVVMFLDSSMWS